MSRDRRTPDRVEAHYKIERELADRLREASRSERTQLYSSVYDELFARVPDHPQLVRKASLGLMNAAVRAASGVLKRYIGPSTVFLEVGAGDCRLSLALSDRVLYVYALEVSREITASINAPQNFALVLSDGVGVPVPPESIDVAYSNQLMEHLHPDDALEQLRNIYQALKPGGVYVCVTPNRLSGPHDVSRHFDREATGFHLKEYTTRELSAVFLGVGFVNVKVLLGSRGMYAACPVWVVRVLENALTLLPARWAKMMARQKLVQSLLGIRLVGKKPVQHRV